MTSDHFLIFSGLSFSIALISALHRSHIVLIASSFNMAISSAVIILAVLAPNNGNPASVGHAFFIIALSSIVNLIFCGVVILVFRSRGTLLINDFRELRG